MNFIIFSTVPIDRSFINHVSFQFGISNLLLIWFGYIMEHINPWGLGGCPSGVMVKAMDYEIVVSEFVLQSRYYVHSRTNTLGKGMNPLILPAMG